MGVRLHALTVLAAEPARLASFWGDLLGWERSGLDLLPDADAPMRLSFEHADLPHGLLNQIHFHLTSYTATQEANVDRALSLGATHLDVGQLPDEDHVVLADPEGNEFCIIEETNTWLAGTGFLGEVAADGTRLVELGASVTEQFEEHVGLADPDGNEFVVRRMQGGSRHSDGEGDELPL